MVAAALDRTALRLEDLRVGVTLPVPIHSCNDLNSMLLLNKGMQLTEESLTKLKARGIDHVYVSSHFATLLRKPAVRKVVPIVASADKIRAHVVASAFHPRSHVPQQDLQTHSRAVALVNERTRDLLAAASIRPNIEAAHEIVEAEVKSLKASCDLFISLRLSTNCDSGADHLHGLQVGRVAMGMALAEGKSDEEIHQIGLGCLLMDIGLSDEARSLRSLARKLTRLEMLEIEKHPSKTYDILAQERKISSTARFLAYQVHERCDGSGYPRGRTVAGISDGALIAMVAESFVAMISTRPHRPTISPTSAVRQLFQMSNCHKIDAKRVETLVSVVSALPVGTRVKLSNGLRGVVKVSRARAPLRPVVELESFEGSEPEAVCLLDMSNVTISELLPSKGEV